MQRVLPKRQTRIEFQIGSFCSLWQRQVLVAQRESFSNFIYGYDDHSEFDLVLAAIFHSDRTGQVVKRYMRSVGPADGKERPCAGDKQASVRQRRLGRIRYLHQHGELVGRLRRAVPEGPFDSAWDDGQRWQIDEAICQALSVQPERVTA